MRERERKMKRSDIIVWTNEKQIVDTQKVRTYFTYFGNNNTNTTTERRGATMAARLLLPGLSALLLVWTLSPLLLSKCDAYPILTTLDYSSTKVSGW
jgi:hypothetical protein